MAVELCFSGRALSVDLVWNPRQKKDKRGPGGGAKPRCLTLPLPPRPLRLQRAETENLWTSSIPTLPQSFLLLCFQIL